MKTDYLKYQRKAISLSYLELKTILLLFLEVSVYLLPLLFIEMTTFYYLNIK